LNVAKSQITIVSNARYTQYDADVDGDYVVYWGNQDQNHHIYLYKISDSSTTRITSVNNSSKGYPKISGNYVVWSDNRNGDYDIFFYDISQPQLGDRPLIVRPYDQYVYDFDKTKLLLMDYQGDFPNINFRFLCYDISTNQEILIKEDPIRSASISGNLVVYDYNSDIYLYNLFTHETEVICDNPAEQHNPTIDGRTIVWEDNRNGDWDLYECTLWYWQSGKHLNDWPLSFLAIERYKSTRSDQRNPNLKNKMLVFTDNSDGNEEIYLLNFRDASLYRLNGQVTKISNSDYEDCNPITDGNKIVWWDDKAPNPNIISEADVYLWQRPPGADLSITINANKNILQINEFITYNISISNLGPNSASNVFMLDTISTKIQIISATALYGDVTINGNIISYNLSSLPPDSSVQITVIGKAIQTGKAVCSGTISGLEPDNIPQNNSAKLTVKINYGSNTQIGYQDYGGNAKIRVDKNGFIHIINWQYAFPILIRYITNKTGKWVTDTVAYDPTGDVFLRGADLDVDKLGNAHICYVIQPYGSTYPYADLYYANNSNGQWISEYPLGPGSGKMFNPKIRIDKNNFVHISYMTELWYGGDLHYLTNKSGSWSNPDTIMMAYNSIAMDVDTNGYAHLVTYDINQGPIYITNAPNGNWQPPEIVEQGWQGGQKETMVLDIVLDKTGNPHISYVGKFFNNEDYKYAVKINGTWQNYFVDSCGFMGRNNAITVDNNNIPYVMYTSPSREELSFAKKDSNAFTNYTILPNVYDDLNFDVDIDQYNNLHYVYSLEDKIHYGTNAEYTVNFGGGDENSGGYFFANSTSGGGFAPSQPTYNWIDPISYGHNIIGSWTEGNADDGYLGPVDLPFVFPFYSIQYNKIYINSNGYISFNKGYTETASSASIPFIDEPNGILAACAMDLNLDTNAHPDSKIFYGGGSDKFIITYYHAYVKYSPADYITFQIIIYPNGNILYQYNNLESSSPLPSSIASDALIGIENETGLLGICYRNNGAGGPIFGSPLAVMFGLNALVLPVEEHAVHLPDNYFLAQNYPNPFNPSTTIKFEIPKTAFVTLKIYNMLGQEVAELLNEEKQPGVYEVNWNASGFASGVYFYKLTAQDIVNRSNQFFEVKKLILIK